MRALLHLLIITSALAAICGCDREPGGAPLSDAVSPDVRIDPIAQLLTNRPTVLAIDRIGNLYWSQETQDGQDTLFTARVDSAPRSTRLSSAAVHEALGPLPSNRTMNGDRATTQSLRPWGNFQSIAVGADGMVYFYFAGGAGAIGRAALGQFDAHSGHIRILLDTQQLGSATTMGRSLDLARGTLIPCGEIIRLLVRHSDQWMMLDLDPRRIPPQGQPALGRSIVNVRVNDADPLDLTRDSLEFFPGPVQDGRTLMLLRDRMMGEMYRVDNAGIATKVCTLAGLPDALSAPAIDAQRNRLVMFAAEGIPIDPPGTERRAGADVRTQYPALLWADATSGKYSALGRDALRGPGNFTIYSLRLGAMVSIGRDTFVGYDIPSGQLLRLHVTAQ